MNLIDKILGARDEYNTVTLYNNKPLFEFIDDTMNRHGDEICKNIGEKIVERFNNRYPTADRIEIRCFEPLWATEYPLGKKYPKYVGCIWCSEFQAGGDTIDYFSHSFIKDLIEHELVIRQPDLKHKTYTDTNLWGEEVEREHYEGKFMEMNDRHVKYKEMTENLSFSAKAYSTKTMMEYKLFQVLNDYLLPYLKREGFKIVRKMHPEYSRHLFDLNSYLPFSKKYEANQFIYLMIPKTRKGK